MDFSLCENEFNQKECCICLEQFTDIDKVAEFHCKHILHDQCSTRIIEENKCPICRKQLFAEPVPDELTQEEPDTFPRDYRRPVIIDSRGNQYYSFESWAGFITRQLEPYDPNALLVLVQSAIAESRDW